MTEKNFKVVVIIISFLLVISCHSSPVAGFTIVDPKPGAIFHPGDRITLKALTGPNERPIAVYLYATQMQYAELFMAEPYVLSFTVPLEFTGTDTLVASAKFADGTMIEKEVEIKIALPLNVDLKSISANPTFISLQKLPSGSDINDIRISETENIGVQGSYSDGVSRYIASSADGTTYTSSNENIATVDTDGKVTAQGPGTATITVRNSKYSATVKVVVKPYKP